MNDFKGVGEALKRVFTQFHWIYILEGFLCFLLIYTVLKILFLLRIQRGGEKNETQK